MKHDYRVTSSLSALLVQVTEQVPEEWRPFVSVVVLLAGYVFHLFATDKNGNISA